MRRAHAILRESAAAAAHQKLSSTLTVVVVAALCASVLLTAGRSEGSANAVLSSIDASGTRSIIVRVQPASGLDTRVLSRLAGIDLIAWVGAFGYAEDVTNAAIPGGHRVSLRQMYTDAPATASPADAPPPSMPPPFATPDTASALGFSQGIGTVVSSTSGMTVDVASVRELPPDLRMLDPVVMVPTPPTNSALGARPVAVLVVRAASPSAVAAVARIVTSVLGIDDPSTVTVQTSERLADVRQQVESRLGAVGRTFVLSVFGGTTALMAAVLVSLVLMRRRDFGRRRALGASRSLIATLVLSQVWLLSVLAAALGAAVALTVLAVEAQPLPSLEFTAAVCSLAVLTSLGAALLPAAVASTRDPLRELRVP